MEETLKEMDPEDYAAGVKGSYVNMARLFLLEIVIDTVLPTPFAESVRESYNYKKRA
jgi:hypothetical protein